MTDHKYKAILEVEVIVPLRTAKDEPVDFDTAPAYVNQVGTTEDTGAFFMTKYGQRDASGPAKFSGKDALKKALDWQRNTQTELDACFPVKIYGRSGAKAHVYVRVDDDEGCTVYGTPVTEGTHVEFDYAEVDIDSDGEPFLREVSHDISILLPVEDLDIDPDHFYEHPRLEVEEYACG